MSPIYLPNPDDPLTDQAQAGARASFGAAFDQAITVHTLDTMLQAWDSARIDWLKRCRSKNTRDSYQTGLNQFYMFIGANPWLVVGEYREAYTRSLQAGVMIHPDDQPEGADPSPVRSFQINPWLVSPYHVNEFIHFLKSLGKSDATIGQRLAACSSLYEHVINDVRLDDQGIERSIFYDRIGRTRHNPFKSNLIQRPEVKQFGRAHSVPVPVITAMMITINCSTLTGARNFALLETFIQTGWRSAEVRQLRWSDIKANPRHRGEFTVHWHGKGDKEQTEAFSRKAYDAIVNYLKLAGRWPVVDASAPIFSRIQNGQGGLGITANEPWISSSQANSVLRNCLRRGLVKFAGMSKAEAEVEAHKYHIHCLRHSHAQRYLEQYGNDLYGLQLRLHHSNPNTTRIYAESDVLKRVEPAKQLDFGY